MQIRNLKVKFKHKDVDLEDVKAMYTLTVVNVRYLKATLNHLAAMVNGLTSKKDEVLRSGYNKRIKVAAKRLKEEELWLTIYTNTLNKHNVTLN